MSEEVKSAIGLMRLIEAPRARHDHPDTSHDAAASMVNGAAVLQQRILVFMLGKYPIAMNAGEMEEELGWPVNRAGRRMCGMRRAGLVEQDGKSKTPTGKRDAYKYRLTPFGLEYARGLLNGNRAL